jgi:hypothetical protein
LLRPAALQRRERAAQHVIHAVVRAGFFDCENVVRFLDDADRAAVTRRADTIEAWIRVGDVVARGAFADSFFCLANRIGKRQRFFVGGTQEMERETLRGLLADSGKMFQSIDESFYWGGKIRHG